MAHWTFTDSSGSYTFDVNPNQGGSPAVRKSINYMYTTSPTGRIVSFEGRRQLETYSISGTILGEDQYYAMITLFSKRNQVTVVDDLGRTYSIYITNLTTDRKPSGLYPWKHTYTCSYVELDWA